MKLETVIKVLKRYERSLESMYKWQYLIIYNQNTHRAYSLVGLVERKFNGKQKEENKMWNIER